RLIHKETRDHASRQSVRRSNERKAPLPEPPQAAIIKSYPQVAGTVFANSEWQLGQRQSVRFGIFMEGFGGALPAKQSAATVDEDAEPEVATRVFEKPVHVLIRQAVSS